MSVSAARHTATKPRGPRAWVNRIPLRYAVAGVAVVWSVVAVELVTLGR